MVLLLLFAVLAGAGTAITPCVLPVLPVLLSTSATGGRRRPLGVVLGLSITFTIAVVALATVIKGVGLADDAVRNIAVVVLLGFGVSLLVPAFGDRIEGWLSRLQRFGPKKQGEGFWSGMIVGAALGFVYAPCAGPILAAVVAGSATTGTTAGTVAVAVAYSFGSALVLLLYAFGSHKLGDRIRRAGRGPTLQRAVGVVMIVTAIAIATNLDVRFQTALANHVPNVIVNPTGELEKSHAVQKGLAELRGKGKFNSGDSTTKPVEKQRPGKPSSLPKLGVAPNFTGTQRWFNTPGAKKLTLADLRGRVVLVDFWTYTCINCLRTLPYLKAWNARYADRGLTIVGVHTPEFAFEHDAGNVASAIKQNGIEYPVAQDNDYATWDAWGNQYWPAHYLIDSKGYVRDTHFGEGAYKETEAAIQSLLQEARGESFKRTSNTHAQQASKDLQTPETYLGVEKADRFLPGPPRAGEHTYVPYKGRLPLSHLTLGGSWKAGPESLTSVRESTLSLRFGAKRVFLVLGPAGAERGRVRVMLDGRPIGSGEAGTDVHKGRVTVKRQRLYDLVALPRVENRLLTLEFEAGVAGYAFTFG